MTVGNKITVLVNSMHNKGTGEGRHICVFGPCKQTVLTNRGVRPNTIGDTTSQELKCTLNAIAICAGGLEGSRKTTD